MSRRCVIVSGGEFSCARGLKEDDFVIACDRGYLWCKRLGLKPDLLISDFDSYSGPVSSEIPQECHPPEKDDTDTMLAMRYAAAHNFDSVLLCCALGGRLDHLLANLQAMHFVRKCGLDVSLQAEDTEICLLAADASPLRLPRRAGWSLSLFALDGPCRGVCALGVKYPLDNAELVPSFPIGVSNEWAAENAELSVREGILTVVLSQLAQDSTP